MSKIRHFANLSTEDQSLFLQAWCLLGWSRVAISVWPFKRLTKSLVQSSSIPPPIPVRLEQLRRAEAIGKQVARAARYTPWKSLCLVQVVTGQRLMYRQKIPGQFFLGAAKGVGHLKPKDDLSAHAWLLCGNKIINGEHGHCHYAVLSTYSWGEAW